jgi:DNA ligase 1
MLLAELVAASAAVGATRSRKQKSARLAACLAAMRPDEAAIGASYLAGCVPQGKIGLGYATVARVEVEPAGAASLELGEVDRVLGAIARLSGPGSGGARERALGALLSRATLPEQAFLRRLLIGELRQGALEGVMVEGIARAAALEVPLVRRALMVSGDLGAVAAAALAGGAGALGQFSIQLFRPVQPMLAQPADDVDEALERLGEASLEYKLDGARIQVHRDGDRVQVFTRRLNEVTSAVPEVVRAALALPGRSLILDGEAIALRPDGSPHPFQVTMRRFGRKAAAAQPELALTPYFFDCLYLDGQSLIDRPGRERVAALDGIGGAWLIPRLITADPGAARRFVAGAIDRGHEGAMAKSLEAGYDAGGRGGSWLKIKPVHTLDLVVLAAEWGSGRRRGWLSNLHLGARDPERGGFVMLGKTFKGMTDEILAWQTQRLQELEIGREGHVVHVRPELVVEIAFNDVQASPHYPGGLALRFARLQRYRSDKRAGDADTIATVRALHEAAARGAPGRSISANAT